MVGVGCSPTPASTIPSNIPLIVSNSSTQPIPIITTQPVIIDYTLYIQNAHVFDITDSTAILEFDSNIPCTATVTLIAYEKEYTKYNLNVKSTFHSQALTFLKPSTPYYVVIEAIGSKSDKTVLTFTTGTQLEIYTIESAPTWFFGGWSNPSSGIIDAIVLNYDGSFSGTTWSVSGFPNTTKQLTLTIRNGTPNQVTVQLDSLMISAPMGGDNKVVLSGNNIIVPAYSNVNYQILAVIGGDAPNGVYQFALSLFY